MLVDYFVTAAYGIAEFRCASTMAFYTVGFIVVILVLLYYYFTCTFDFWQKRGVKGPKPIPFFGTYLDVFLAKKSINDCFTNAYYTYKHEPFVGLFMGSTPQLILKDAELLKDILIKDFNCFAERTLGTMDELDPLSAHLFNLDAPRWKPLRNRLSPVFTASKIKEMFHLLLECADHFDSYLNKLVAKGDVIECYEISAKFTTDVIGSCAFGIEMNAMTAEKSEFSDMGQRVCHTSWKSTIMDRLREFPFMFKIFGRFLIDYELVKFFTRITRETMDYRIRNNVRRDDIMDGLVDLKQHPEKLGVEKVDDVYIAAQSFVFFIGGFETSATTLSNFFYEMALQPSIQDKVRAEIKQVLQKTNGVITYDSISDMKYLDACFQETLRKYPVVSYLARMAVSDYTFSGTKVSIPKGTKVYIPVYGIQRDPKNYPEPEVFNPDRFTDGRAATIHPMHFLPFGDGPRNCIGARFAKIQMKVAAVTLLSKYKVDVCEKTQLPYILDPKALFLLRTVHGIYVKMTNIED